MTSDLVAEGARTVAHMATYLEELKSNALAMADEFEAVERGYFRPDEEQRVRQLQVSYWQTRGALFELIDSLRRAEQPGEEHDPAAFLVAYAAAVLLVDAARFLREHFHEHAGVRHKLDEPDEQFGIPARMYDTVQKSLTSPRHAWHLYHAIHFFDDHESEIRALAGDPALAPALAVADRLGHRVRVSLATYAKARLRVRGRRLARHIGRGVFGRAVYGLQKVVSSMMADQYVRPGHHPGLPDEIRSALAARLAPGDVLIVRKEYALTNYFLPGHWPHAALYLGTAQQLEAIGLTQHEQARSRWSLLKDITDGEPRRVLEAMKDGVRVRGVGSPMASDSIVVVRPRISRDEIAAALARGLSHEGKPYDFDFDFSRADRLVCTEVVYRTYDRIGGIELELIRRAGRSTLSAGDLLRVALAGEHFQPVAVYAPAHGPGLVEGEQARQIIEQAECGDAEEG